jgi:predicted amidohydrolase
MRIAACQMRSGDDVDANVATAESLLHEAADGGADLAVLPEVFPFLGSPQRVPGIAETIPGGSIAKRLAEVARAREMWIAGGSIQEADEGRVFNTLPLFDRGGQLVARYRKIHMFDVDLPDQPPFRESATYAPGAQLVTYPTELARLGFAICYDLRFPELFRGLATLGAEVIMLPAQFQHATGRAHWHVLLRARAIENQCFVVAASQWGTYGDPDQGRRSYGHSIVVGPWGDVIAEAAEEETCVTFADLDLSELRRVRSELPALTHRRLGITC